MDGAFAPKVLKMDKPCGLEGCGIAAFSGDEYIVKTTQPPWRAREMHPYSRFVGLLLKGSMSLDFRVALLPYKSSSFATPEGEVCSSPSFGTHKHLKGKHR